MHRPAFYLATAFSCGILLCRLCGPIPLVPSALLALALAYAGARIPRRHASTAVTVLAAVCAGFFACARYECALDRGDLKVIFGERSARIGVRGILLAVNPWEKQSAGKGPPRYRAAGFVGVREVETASAWVPARGTIRAALESGRPIELACGDSVQLVGTLRRIRGGTNPAQFDPRAFWRRRGVEYSISAKGESQIRRLDQGRAGAFFKCVDAVRMRFRRGLEAGIPEGPERQIVLAMILGYRENIGDEINRDFQLTNTMHILSISGLHVAFFYLALNWVLRSLGANQRVAAIVAIPLIAAYTLITGMAVPVVRSAVMFVAFLSAPFFSRERDTINSLGVAALVLLAVNPLQLFDVGFQLSFLAVLSILLFAQPIVDGLLRIWPCRPEPGQLLVGRAERVRWYFGEKLILLCATSVATWIGMTPFIARYFHIATLLGMLGNVVVIPAGFAIVCLGFSAALASLISIHIAAIFNVLNYCVVWIMLASIKYIGLIPCTWRYVAAPGPFRFIAYYGIVAAAWFAWSRRWDKKRRLASLGAALCMLLPLAFRAARPQLRIVFLDVGQGDAAYCEFPGGEGLLIDGGPQTGMSAGRMIVRPFLQSMGKSGVDTVLLTHAHDDHIDGLFTALGEFSVRRLVLGGSAPSFDNCKRLLNLARANGVKAYRIARGDRLAEGEGAVITALNPAREPTHSDPNNDSVALMVEYGGVKILLCGDMAKEAEADLCRSGLPLKADVLKIGHHGGRGSSTGEFLKRVSPKWAIVSAGENNRFGHPSPEALARLRERGCKVLRTDLHGAITITTDGEKIEVRTFR